MPPSRTPTLYMLANRIRMKSTLLFQDLGKMVQAISQLPPQDGKCKLPRPSQQRLPRQSRCGKSISWSCTRTDLVMVRPRRVHTTRTSRVFDIPTGSARRHIALEHPNPEWYTYGVHDAWVRLCVFPSESCLSSVMTFFPHSMTPSNLVQVRISNIQSPTVHRRHRRPAVPSQYNHFSFSSPYPASDPPPLFTYHEAALPRRPGPISARPNARYDPVPALRFRPSKTCQWSSGGTATAGLLTTFERYECNPPMYALRDDSVVSEYIYHVPCCEQLSYPFPAPNRSQR